MTKTRTINFHESDGLIDTIAEFIKTTIDDRTPPEQEYILRSLDDCISNIGFDRGFEIILIQSGGN